MHSHSHRWISDETWSAPTALRNKPGATSTKTLTNGTDFDQPDQLLGHKLELHNQSVNRVAHALRLPSSSQQYCCKLFTETPQLSTEVHSSFQLAHCSTCSTMTSTSCMLATMCKNCFHKRVPAKVLPTNNSRLKKTQEAVGHNPL